MALLQDLQTVLGVEPYATTQTVSGEEDTINITLLTGPIDDFSEVVNTLPENPEFSEENIALTGGQTVSLYGFSSEAENILIYLVQDSQVTWAHVFSYEDEADYSVGKTLQVPAAELRV